MNALIGLFGFLILIGGSIIIILARRRDTIDDVQKKRNEANEGLIKVRDTELSDCKKQCEKCNEELEDITAEHRTLVGLKVTELLGHWADREDLLARLEKAEQRVRILEKAQK